LPRPDSALLSRVRGRPVGRGLELSQVTATDADIGNNALINYIINAGDPGDNFDIDSSTGVIITNGTVIDREMVSNYTLNICVSLHTV